MKKDAGSTLSVLKEKDSARNKPEVRIITITVQAQKALFAVVLLVDTSLARHRAKFL